MRILIEAQSIMERDALVAALEDAGIASQAEHRDLSRRITNNTLDFSYEGISILQNGFKVSVLDEDFEQAQIVLADFQKRVERPSLVVTDDIDHLSKFYFASLFSILFISLPITLPVALYHLYHGIRSGEKASLIKLLFSFLCLFGALAGLLWFLLRRFFV